MENISYGGKSEIPEIRDSRDKKITRVTAHSLTGPSSLTDTVDDTGHMPRKWKSCPPLVVYLNLRPPGLSRCTVRLPILDWGRRRPTQRNHLPKKTQYCKCSSKRSESVVLSSYETQRTGCGKLTLTGAKVSAAGCFCFPPSQLGLLLAPPLVKVGETRAAACS